MPNEFYNHMPQGITYKPVGQYGLADPFSPVYADPRMGALPNIMFEPSSASEYMRRRYPTDLVPYPHGMSMPIDASNPLHMGIQFGLIGAAGGLGWAGVSEALRRYHGEQGEPMGGTGVLKHILVGGLIGSALGTMAGYQMRNRLTHPTSWADLQKGLEMNGNYSFTPGPAPTPPSAIPVAPPAIKSGQSYGLSPTPVAVGAPLIGAIIGALMSRKGHAMRGAGYGALTGGAAGLGSYIGGNAGRVAGGLTANMDSAIRGSEGLSPGTAMVASGAEGLGAGAGGIGAALATLNALRKHHDPWGEKEAQAIEKQALGPFLLALGLGGSAYGAHKAFNNITDAGKAFLEGNNRAGNSAALGAAGQTAMLPLNMVGGGAPSWFSKVPWLANLITQSPRLAKWLGTTAGIAGPIVAGKATSDLEGLHNAYRDPIVNRYADFKQYGFDYAPSGNLLRMGVGR